MQDTTPPSAPTTIAVWVAALAIPVITLPGVLFFTFVILLFGTDSPNIPTRDYLAWVAAPCLAWLLVTALAVVAVALWSRARRRAALVCLAAEYALVFVGGSILLLL